MLATRIGDGDLLQRDALSNAFAAVGEASVPALVAALRSDRVGTREHAAEALGHLGMDAVGAADALEVAAADADPRCGSRPWPRSVSWVRMRPGTSEGSQPPRVTPS
ncbi:HEAT repeat domain-containing protein [Tessaracoccus coleopterorum]|uniref:hypothetical protein n=1 Tax=Tessaracoccus coleopterorum TaxID=2714950 RepID=UPI001E632BF2|nr:hypothetical protein [Tessaracoccus coleopterorum]